MTDNTPVDFRAENGIVVELFPAHPSGLPIDECYPAALGVTPIPNGVDGKSVDVAVGMTFDGKAFGPPPAPPPAPVVARQATGTQIMTAIHDLGLAPFFSQAVTAAQVTKPIDAWYFNAITPNDFYAENNAKLGRISTSAILLAKAAVPPVVFTLATVFDKALTE